jgi:hypothetical protein
MVKKETLTLSYLSLIWHLGFDIWTFPILGFVSDSWYCKRLGN